MSASLVGSEMCIRDRATTPHVKSFERTCPTCDRGRRTIRGEITGVEEAVSYTHLTLPTICSV
eukprot:1068978-Alexandrium_andersonii.AAC.1